MGEDPSARDWSTPRRVEKSLRFLTSGYEADVDEVINGALFTVDYSEMVIVKDIDFYSLCEHHLLPFFGKCHVAYVPQGRVIGLSKIPRLVDVFARRLQVQERMTNQIADVIQEKINPLGVAVVVEGTHLCMAMRGVEKQNSFAVTSAMHGVFREDLRTRSEFLELIRRRSPNGVDGGARRSSRERRPGDPYLRGTPHRRRDGDDHPGSRSPRARTRVPPWGARATPRCVYWPGCDA